MKSLHKVYNMHKRRFYIMPKNSPARIKANNKYSSIHYQGLTVKIKPSDYNMIDSYCKDNNISKASFIVKACKDYINNHNSNE